MAQYQPVMTVPELQSFLRQAFPAEAHARIGVVAEIAPGLARMHLDPGPESLRPGDLVSGPTQMALVDVAACLLYTSPSPRDQRGSRMPSSA